MADNTLFDRLKRLFSADVIIRNVGGDQLKVSDTNRIQSSGNLATNSLVDRYTRLFNSRVPVSGYSPGEALMVYRKEMFTDYEAMETDPILASYLDIVSDECTTKDEFGETLTIRSNNPKVQKILHNLFYDILNVEFNLWPWIRNLTKYGDFYLYLKLVEKFGVIGVEPLSTFQMIREEGFNPDNPDDVRFKMDPSSMGSRQYVPQTGKSRSFENYEIAHFRLLADTNFLPYGKSILEPARKIWKQLTLMEDAMLIQRIMRAPAKRVFKIDVGNIPPNEVDAYMQKIIQQTKKVPFQDPTTGDYNLKFNMQNAIEDFYIPVRGTESGTSIDVAAGLEYDGITDVEYLKTKLCAALRVPKAFLNFEEGVSGKATLAAEDMRFSRTIERLQRIVLSELYKIAIIHLYIQGFQDAELLDFELTMTAPSTIYEKEKIELWQSKVNLAKDLIDSGLASIAWIYKNIFNMPDSEYATQRELVLVDAKHIYRYNQIKDEGNDPVKTGKSFGTSHDIAQLYKAGDGTIPGGYDEKEVSKSEDDVKGSLNTDDPNSKKRNPSGSGEKLGRPEKHTTYGTHDHPMGYDPLGAKENNKLNEKQLKKLDKFRKDAKSILLESKVNEEEQMKNEPDSGLLDEHNILDTEHQENL